MPKFVYTSVLICVGGILGYGLAIAQISALDPVRAAPHIFENVFENERLRVLKVTERNGETAPLHTHPDRLLVHLSPCAWMEVRADGEQQMQSFKLGDTTWAPRITHGGETSHVVQDCSRLEIEMK
jgi:quercetin dioxygenase-like cupin family protein